MGFPGTSLLGFSVNRGNLPLRQQSGKREQLGALLRPLASSPALVGLSVADFVPDKDSDGYQARRLVDLVGGLLVQRTENT